MRIQFKRILHLIFTRSRLSHEPYIISCPCLLPSCPVRRFINPVSRFHNHMMSPAAGISLHTHCNAWRDKLVRQPFLKESIGNTFKQKHFVFIAGSNIFGKRGICFYFGKANLFQNLFHFPKPIKMRSEVHTFALQ